MSADEFLAVGILCKSFLRALSRMASYAVIPLRLILRQYRTNEVIGWRMDFSSDANADFEGLLEVNQEICMPQMAEKTEPDAPPNCAVVS